MLVRVLLPPLLAVVILALSNLTAWPHGGGLDSYGCHNDRKHGGYHCHRGQLAGQVFSSQTEMLAILRQGQSEPSSPPLNKPQNRKERACVRDEQTGRLICGEPVR